MARKLKTATYHRTAESSEERNATLQKLHGELYTILAEILRVCEILGLHPFLQGGSAIGAFFDKAIIPWDDVPLHHGIFVDIMPYDKVPDNQRLQKRQRFLANKLENIIINSSLWKYWYKRKLVTDSFDNFIYSLKAFLWSGLFSKRLACKWYVKVCSAYNHSDTTKCSFYNQVRQKRDHIAVESIDNPELVDFGTLKAYVPGNVENYLRHHYPNLRRSLPENERESHMPERIEFSDGSIFTNQSVN